MTREITVTIETTSAGITVDPGDTRVVRLYRDGDPVPSINGLPAGGTTGQVLAKTTDADYDADWVTGGGGSSVWGGITGTLSDQTDLQAALDAKEASGTAAAAVAAHVAAVDPHADRAYTDSAIATKLDDLSAGTADAIVTASADGTLLSRAAYTIATLLAAARDRATHTGTQLASTISDFASAALSAVTWSTLTGKPSVFTPDTHATSHQSGGSDAIKLDDLAAPDDNTDLDATTSAHGLLPKLGGGSTNFLRADGTWAAPPGGSPAGSGTELQYRLDGTTFGAVAGSSFDGTTLTLPTLRVVAGTWETGGAHLTLRGQNVTSGGPNIFLGDLDNSYNAAIRLGFYLGTAGLAIRNSVVGAAWVGNMDFGFGGNTTATSLRARIKCPGNGVLAFLSDPALVAAQSCTLRVHDLYGSSGANYERMAVSGSAITLESGGTGSVNRSLTLSALGTGVIACTSPVKPPSYTVATVPSAAVAGAGAKIYVTDESGGSVDATSDGTNWRRSTDRAVIS